MQTDLTKLRQSLFNLLSNACKFTNEGVVSLEVRRYRGENGAPSEMVFEVRDTGIGLTQEQKLRLFQAFSQGDASTTRQYGGTGLGLCISRRFCQLMGGDIVVESEPGKGSIFTIHLPLNGAVEEVSEVRSSLVDEQVIPWGKGTNSVLIVDDDPKARDLLTRFLIKENYSVACAADGEEGVNLARELRPGIILLDVLMPTMDGWSVLSTLKGDPELADIPVIMLTVMEDKNLGFTLGADEFLSKPFDRKRLLAVLEKYHHDIHGGPVLLVEDDGVTRQMLRNLLEKDGRTVIEAGNGQEALERMASTVPALILLDLMMPVMDGFEFLAELKKDTVHRDIPVVVVTARDLTVSEREQLEGMVIRVLQKGAYTRDELLSEVRQRMENHSNEADANKVFLS